jgi:hypothetical protein
MRHTLSARSSSARTAAPAPARGRARVLNVNAWRGVGREELKQRAEAFVETQTLLGKLKGRGFAAAPLAPSFQAHPSFWTSALVSAPTGAGHHALGAGEHAAALSAESVAYPSPSAVIEHAVGVAGRDVFMLMSGKVANKGARACGACGVRQRPPC